MYNITGVYLTLSGDNIPNHGYVVIHDIGNTSESALVCNTNYLPDGGGHSGGLWYGSDGQTVGTNTIFQHAPGFLFNRDPGQVQLIRSTAAGTPAEGIYRCEVADDTFATQTVYAGLYNSGGGWFLCIYMCIMQEHNDNL